MKRLLIVLLLFPTALWAQSKGDNTLEVSSTATFQEVGRQLILDGYELGESNAEFGTLTTAWRDIKFIKYRLVLAVLEDKVVIQSKWMNESANGVLNTQGSENQVSFKKGGVEGDIWERMEVFASHFGTEIRYLKK